MEPRVGDKVRIKAEGTVGPRGVLVRVEGKKLLVKLNGSEDLQRVGEGEVTNFSLAARRAWKSSPDRAVGRKKGTKLSDRVSVTLRIDREVWEAFLQKEVAGEIIDRPATINRWFRKNLAEDDCVVRGQDAQEGQ